MGTGDSPGVDSGGDTSRRCFLRLAGATALTTGLAGCGRVTSYEFSAPPVVLPRTARAAADYETVLDEAVVAERSRTVAGVDVRATVESHVAVYGATDETQRRTPTAPIVGAASTPTASVMGRSFNPLARLSLADLPTSTAGAAFLRRAGLDDVGHDRAAVRWHHGPTFVASREGTCLDARTTFESYAGVLDGERPTVAFVHLARVVAESVVVAAAVHGHDVADADRSFVGSAGYLPPAALDEAAGTFAETSAALRYVDGG